MILFNAHAFNSFINTISEETTPDTRFFKLAITEHDRFMEREDLRKAVPEDFVIAPGTNMFLITPDSKKGGWQVGGGNSPIEVLASVVNRNRHLWGDGSYGLYLWQPQKGVICGVLAKPLDKFLP